MTVQKIPLKRVKIHREGLKILLVTFIILFCINILLLSFSLVLGIISSVISSILYLLMVNFFRSPKRNFNGNRDYAVVSSVDGKVVALEEVFEPEYLKTKCIQISVFMTIFDVHANWFPVNGEVIYCTHHNGRFLSAYLPKSSIENERSTIVIEANNGQKILVRQIAGAVARRIVTYAEPGMEANIEEHLGFIKFGSRVDIYLPLDIEILTHLGAKTRGGITEIARLSSHSIN